MSRWAMATLGSHWGPSEYLARDPIGAFPKDYSGPSSRLEDIAVVFRPSLRSDGIEPIVSPSGIDADSGQVVSLTPKRLERVYRAEPGELREGDVLVPERSGRPCLLVSDDLMKYAFSGHFILVRSLDYPPALLWAVLSSHSGSEARRSASVGALGALTVSGLVNIHIPLFAGRDERDALLERILLAVPKPSIRLSLLSHQPSKWIVTELSGRSDWTEALGEVNPADKTGRSLGEFCSIRQATTWSVADDVAEGRTSFFLSRNGANVRMKTRTDPPADPANWICVSCREDYAAPLQAYLISPGGKQRLRSATRGAYSPHLTIRDLRNLCIPWPLSMGCEEPGHSPQPLIARLEGLLWT